jgi:hypothetical protein
MRRLAARRLLAIAIMLAAAACADARPRTSLKERMAKEGMAAATTTAAPPVAFEPAPLVAPICTDTSEIVAMRCAEGVATRSGDTIILRLSNVGAAKRVDVPAEDDGYRRYYYAGRFGGDNGTPAFHILDVRTRDGGEIELINAATGDSLIMHGVPLLSPAGSHFAAVAEPESCMLPTQLEIWRVTGDKPVREYAIEPFNCVTDKGWGPSSVAWRSRDTITLLRTTLPADSTRRANGEREATGALLVRLAGKWTLDTSAAARRLHRSSDTR